MSQPLHGARHTQQAERRRLWGCPLLPQAARRRAAVALCPCTVSAAALGAKPSATLDTASATAARFLVALLLCLYEHFRIWLARRCMRL